MKSDAFALQLLESISESGYFDAPTFDPSNVIALFENKMSISRARAIDMLVQSGFCELQYDEGAAPRDVSDRWKLSLTSKGAGTSPSAIDP